MIPIRLKQMPQFLLQTLQRSWLLRRKPTRRPVFRLCFFSCRSYFRFLYCSLHSLITFLPDTRYEVIVFNDKEMPLAEAQIDALKELIPNIKIVLWPKSMGWGEEQISWIWKAYEYALEGLEDGDLIARIDSDIFFFNDKIFRAVECSNADFVGDGHYVGFEYCQGGCYFFRASAIRRIVALQRKESLTSLLNAIDVKAEDVAASYFASRLGMKIWMTWIMMYPDELRNAKGLTYWARWKFSCAHFVMKNKQFMLDSYNKEILKGCQPPVYYEAMQIE